MLSPRVLLAYFTGGFLLYFLHATLLHALTASARGRAVSFGASVRAAARRAGDILLLSALVFGVLLFLEVAYRKFEPRLPRAVSPLARLAVWLLQNGVQMGASLVLAACMDEDVSLLQGFERAHTVAVRQTGPVALAWLGAAAVGGELVVGAFAVPFFCGFMAFPAMSVFWPDGNLSAWLGLWWINEAYIVIGAAFLIGILGAAFAYSLYLIMEALVAVGMLLHRDAASGEEPPMVAYLRKTFPRMAA